MDSKSPTVLSSDSSVFFTGKESSAVESTPNIAAPWRPDKRIKIIVLGQTFVVFAISLDMTILTATLPTVAQALHTGTVKTYWIAASYMLANAVVQPVMAALADVFGRRSIIFAALMLFTIGSIVCCTANNVAAMLAGRTIQGVGGGGILSVNVIILSDLIPLSHRPKYIGLQQIVVSLGFNIAPIIAGALLKTSWRWIFYINLPFCGIGLIIIPFVLRYERSKTTFQAKLSSVDWIGSISFVVGMTAFLVGVTWGGSQFAWRSAATLVPLVFGVLIVGMTGVYERYWAKHTFLRLSLFNSWPSMVVYTCTVLQALTLFTLVYFLVLYFLTVKLYSPLMSGVCFLAFCLVCVPASGIVGAVITKVGSYRWAVWSGWVINTLAMGIFTLLKRDTSTVAWVWMSLVAGIGQGLLLIAHTVASQAACQPRDAAYATSMYSFMRSLGLCLGIALGETIFQNFFLQHLSHLGLPTSISNNSAGFALVLKNMAPSAEKESIISAYVWSFQMLFATLCGISGLGLVLSVFIRGHSLNQQLDTVHRLRDGHPASDSEGDTVA